MEEYKIHKQDEFLAKNKKRFDTKVEEPIKPKGNMNDFLNTINDVASRIHVGNVIDFDRASAKPTKKDENPLHGGTGKNIQM